MRRCQTDYGCLRVLGLVRAIFVPLHFYPIDAMPFNLFYFDPLLTEGKHFV